MPTHTLVGHTYMNPPNPGKDIKHRRKTHNQLAMQFVCRIHVYYDAQKLIIVLFTEFIN